MSNALGLDACSFKLRLSSVRSEAERNHYSKEWPCSPGVWMVRWEHCGMCAWVRWALLSSLKPSTTTRGSCESLMTVSDVCQRSATGWLASGPLRCGSVLACVMLCTLCCALASM